MVTLTAGETLMLAPDGATWAGCEKKTLTGRETVMLLPDRGTNTVTVTAPLAVVPAGLVTAKP